jgi:hypothetical protein
MRGEIGQKNVLKSKHTPISVGEQVSIFSLWYEVGKISSRITISLLITFQSKLVCESYEPTKS